MLTCINMCAVLKIISVMSDFLQPYELQPARLLCPWDSPGKNTAVVCLYSPPGDLPNLGIEPTSLMSPTLADKFFTTSTTWETCFSIYSIYVH